MKPRAFIGSSVEGLNVAYSVQQNLLHDAEVTVWDQGVFEISATSIESLSKAIESTDFGIFVFNPDDVVKMREQEFSSVRDNVLFEMGLFIGKLGRERVFFLVPSETDLHIPTDLIGITPGKYEVNRSDGSMQAATAPACHQIRNQIKKLGPTPASLSTPSAPEELRSEEVETKIWIIDFFDKKYASARAKLEAKLNEASGDDVLYTQSWIYYCEFKENPQIGFKKLYDLANSKPDSALLQITAARILKMENYVKQARKLLENVSESIKDNFEVKLVLSECFTANDDPETALLILQDKSISNIPEIAVAIVDILESLDRKPEALNIIHACYMENPNDKFVRYRYARLALDLERYSMSLYLLNKLTQEAPDSSEYWGYLGNSCVALSLHDKALVAYRKAESLQKGDSGQWIISNIGNLLSFSGFPSEACTYLEKAIKMDIKSEYAHSRLSGALKKIEEETTEYQKKCKEGYRQIKEMDSLLENRDTSVSTENISNTQS
jgi:Predicted nucleotide-binding protein containing TIR-like domain